MALPNFTQVKTINDLLNQIQQLENKLSEKTKDLEFEEEKVTKERKTFKQTVISNNKQQILLESIQSEIEGLKILEKDLRSNLNKEIDQKIEEFFTNGGFTRFTNELFQSLKKDGEVEVFAGSDAKQYFPVETPKDYTSDRLALRIKTTNKTYILDIDKVKVQMKDQVFKTQMNG